jgi:hypothetical protein
MKLPKYELAIVHQQKISGYLLSTIHAHGKGKAAFFTRYGFSGTSWEILAEALLDHASEHEVRTLRTTLHGTNYVIEGELQTPDGRNPQVRSVWCVRHDDVIPYLVTAYPLEEEA